MINTSIIIRFTAEGFHNWPEAPPTRDYLRARHRHLFHVEVEMSVNHQDREVEFHDLLDECRRIFPGGEMGRRSCEEMAIFTLSELQNRYPRRRVSVSVYEDGEVGAKAVSD